MSGERDIKGTRVETNTKKKVVASRKVFARVSPNAPSARDVTFLGVKTRKGGGRSCASDVARENLSNPERSEKPLAFDRGDR